MELKGTKKKTDLLAKRNGNNTFLGLSISHSLVEHKTVTQSQDEQRKPWQHYHSNEVTNMKWGALLSKKFIRP